MAVAPIEASAPAPGGGGTLAPVEHEGLHRPSGRSGLGFALAFSTVLLWAILPLGLKIALQGIDAMTLTWYRFSAAAAVLGVILALRGALPPLASLHRRHWRLLVVATTCLATNYGCYVLGLDRTNASTSQVVIQLAPMMLALGGVLVFQERFGALQWVGLGTLMVGLLLFSHDQVVNMIEGLDRYYAGIGFLVVAGIAWALYGLAQKQLLGRLPSPAIMLCIYVGGAVIFAPFARPAGILDLSAIHAGALLFCIVNMLLAYGTFSEALAHWEASRVSAVLAITPLVTLAVLRITDRAVPALLAPEPISLVGLVGAVLVVAGSLLASLGKR